MTIADIRYHMNNLMQDGLVEPAGESMKKQLDRGRPIKYYRLSDRAGENNYQELCASLLSLFLEKSGDQTRNRALDLLASKLAPKPFVDQPLTKKINSLIDWLNHRAYHARWEATSEGPQIKFFHCPYAAILPSYPELCQLDLKIIENILQLPALQKSQMNYRQPLPNACLFVLGSGRKP